MSDGFGDFEPRAIEDVVLEQLVRGVSRRAIVDELRLSLAVINEHVVQLAKMHHGAAGSTCERVAVLEASLDDITQRTYDAIEASRRTAAPLLVVLLGALRLRTALTRGRANS